MDTSPTISQAPFLLSRAAASPAPAPAPRGHFSHTGNPDSLATLATLAHDPTQPRYVRRWHRAALNDSLFKLASRVRTVASR